MFEEYNIKYKKLMSRNLNKILYFFLIFQLSIIFLSLPLQSYLSYFWPDHIYLNYVHNLSLGKNILEVLNETNNINGITLTIINPYLNPLSFLNYNLEDLSDYKIYLITLRFLEFATISLHVKFFTKKFSIKEISGLLFLYIIYLANTKGFDHQSYINFPILIFCFFHGLALYLQKNNIIFFSILCIANIWSYLINPIYFFVTCFAPLLFYYSFFIYKKKYKKIILIFIANLICSIPFVLISIGTARIGTPDLFPGSFPHYNFTIYQSKSFLILALILAIISIKLLYEKKEYFFSSIFLFFNFITIVFGAIYKFKIDSWKLPQPEYLDYSFQYIYISIVFMIIYYSKKNLFTIFLLMIFVLAFGYRSYNFYTANIKLDNLPEKIHANHNGDYLKKFFWEKSDKDFFLKKDLQNNILLIDLPSFESDLYNNSFINKDLSTQGKWELTKYYYNTNFNGSLSWLFFWKSKIVINEGHSQYLDISTAIANSEKLNFGYGDNLKWNTKDKMYFNGTKLIERQSVPNISNNSPLVNLYNVEFILSDKILDFEIYKKYNFKNYKIYLYKTNYRYENLKIDKINYISNLNGYKKNIKKLGNELFILKNTKTDSLQLNKFCKINRIRDRQNKLIFNVETNNKNCVAIFPIPFSYNNNFFIKNNLLKKKCDTFRAQFYFHACIFTKDTKVQIKKNNIILYPFGSLKDFIENKKLKI